MDGILDKTFMYSGAMDEAECYVVCVGKRPGFVRRTLVGELPYSSAPIYCHFESNFAVSI